jgi:DNA-binding MarR family transcriptional regulator
MREDDSTDAALLDALVQMSFAVIAAVSAVAARHDLSLTQLRVLAILRDRTPTMSELATHLGLDRSTVTGLINRATERGLVERLENTTDKRSSRVGLTTSGARQVASGASEVATAIAPLVGHLTSLERKRLTALLGSVMRVRSETRSAASA